MSFPTHAPSSDLAFTLGSGFWAMVSDERLPAVLLEQTHRAQQVVAESGHPVPQPQERFELIVKLAVEAELLFFTAALREPSQEERDEFFGAFIQMALHANPVLPIGFRPSVNA